MCRTMKEQIKHNINHDKGDFYIVNLKFFYYRFSTHWEYQNVTLFTITFYYSLLLPIDSPGKSHLCSRL